MEIKRAFDFLYYQASTYPRYDYLSYKYGGLWKHFSTQEAITSSRNVAKGLISLGIGVGDKVAIVSHNRPEWAIVDFAIQQIGAVSVPMYPTITVEDYRYIFAHAEVKIAFAENQELAGKVLESTAEQPLAHVFSFDKLPNIAHWTEVEAAGKPAKDDELEARTANIKENDLMTIIYTSGTTGQPKGVMLSHRNIVSNVIGVAPMVPVVKGHSRALSFLPMCHIYERTALYANTYLGVAIYFAESMEKIAENLREIKPETFNTVPRLLEKVYDKIVTKGYELAGFKRRVFFWALKLAHQYDPNRDMGWWYEYQHKWADKLVYSKWREALGGNIRGIASGAAALQPRLAKVFWAAGIKIGEGYGLTETSPVISASIMTHDNIKIGYVGKVIEGVEVNIADDGEILVKGPNVMLGYYKQPDLTAQVIKNGWFHTGDIGQLEKGYLKITDRKKEMFKTSGGKYIAPQILENRFKESAYIEHVMVVGEGRKFPSALVVPNIETLLNYATQNGIPTEDQKKLLIDEKIQALFQKEFDQLNSHFGQWEKVKKFKLLHKPWGVDTGELTPTMKIKRKVIVTKYESHIEEMYSDQE